MITDAWREECGRAAMSRRDQVRARGDRPSQRRNAPDGGGRSAMLVPARMTIRAQGDGGANLEFRGVASAYEQAYEMYDMFGPYMEVVSAGAGAKSLGRPDLDVPLVLQHDDLRRIARTTNGSLFLTEADEGLDVHAPELDAADLDVAYIAPKIDKRLIDEMSFKFRIMIGQWSPDYTEFRIQEYDIHRGDVAIVGYGANPYTSGSMRGHAVPAVSVVEPRPAASARLAMMLDLALAD